MSISPKGVLEIAEHEGIVLGPYKDSVGVWTYGVGHTKGAGLPNPEKMPKEDTRSWSEDRVVAELRKAIDLFSSDLEKYAARVDQAIKVPLLAHERDALVSFDFNTGGIHRANLTKEINSGNKSGNGFMGWVRPKEIIKRRKAEQALFRTGNYDANGDQIPVYDALGDGRLKYRRAMRSSELSRYMPEKVSIPAPAGTGKAAAGIGAAGAAAAGAAVAVAGEHGPTVAATLAVVAVIAAVIYIIRRKRK